MMDRESKKGVRISTVTKRYTAEVVLDSLMKAKLLRSTSLLVSLFFLSKTMLKDNWPKNNNKQMF